MGTYTYTYPNNYEEEKVPNNHDIMWLTLLSLIVLGPVLVLQAFLPLAFTHIKLN